MTYAIPLRYFLIIVRSLFLKEIGLSVLWPLLIIGAAIFGLSVMRFRKHLG